jgi:hypothetical protein
MRNLINAQIRFSLSLANRFFKAVNETNDSITTFTNRANTHSKVFASLVELLDRIESIFDSNKNSDAIVEKLSVLMDSYSNIIKIDIEESKMTYYKTKEREDWRGIEREIIELTGNLMPTFNRGQWRNDILLSFRHFTKDLLNIVGNMDDNYSKSIDLVFENYKSEFTKIVLSE